MSWWNAMLILAFLLLACEKNKLAEIPAFVTVDSIEFAPVSGQGTSQQLISEIWIYADSQLIGAYPVPSVIPVLGTEMIHLDIFAGIRENGQAASPVIYPLIAPWRTDIVAGPGRSLVITPRFSYARNVVFPLVEDFESGNLFRQDLDGDSLTFFRIEPNSVIEGRSAQASLTAAHPVLEVASNFSYALPDVGSPVFLEMEYAAETSLAIGLRTDNGTAIYKLLLFANDQVPKKIYVNFTQEVQAAKARDYQVIFRASFDGEGGKDSQDVIIDNIKLLHFHL